MTTITLEIPDELAQAIHPVQDRLPEILALGLERMPPAPASVYRYILAFLASAPTAQAIANFRPTPDMIGAFVGLDVYLVRPAIRRVDPDFLFIALNDIAAVRQLKASATAGALPRIPKQALDDVLLPLPPMEKQRRIARLGILAADCERLLRQRLAAEAKLNAALISRLLRTPA